MNSIGIFTAIQLADSHAPYIRKHFSVMLERIVRELNGESWLDKIFLPGRRYQKAGVILGDFYSVGIAQLNLFDEYKPGPNSDALMQVMDTINHSGRGAVWFAGQGIQQSWQMKREMLSPV